MGCCASKGAGKSGFCRRSPAKPPPPQSAQSDAHLPGPRSSLYPTPEEETVVKEVLSETPLPKRSSPEAREGDKARNLRVEDEAPETKILISKLEAAAEIVSEYSEMCSAASGSLSTATTVAATDKVDQEVTSGDLREPRWERRMNADRYRSPVKVQRKSPSAAGVRRPQSHCQSHSRSPARRAQAGMSEPSCDRRRDFSGELRARQRNAGPAGRGTGANSRRSSRSPAPAPRRDGVGNKPSGPVKVPSVGAQNGRKVNSQELPGGREDIDGERTEKTDEVTDGAPLQEGGSESLIENPHVSLECFIFL
ncbi:hypothetical protein SAY87_017628 [Trapa incisa]|uniref:Uncharacterized protein n=1 Tax=Trapa incisa TaxID=236973 RepID=A0AAN7LA92_9MYRT|nr:hypothetical protein SAY87_017628 [Trapa incisa]